jgi:FlaA1/EpsC-like NDP-sugar epimerase
LSGLQVKNESNPDGDIEIKEVGLRPGEKLFEELIIGNNSEKTKHERIMMAQENFTPWPELIKLLHEMRQCRDREETISLLEKLVPEFEHNRDNFDQETASEC